VCWLHASRQRDTNDHRSAGSGDRVARGRALLSLVLTRSTRSTRSDLTTTARRCPSA
jgi:hypothetical protein